MRRSRRCMSGLDSTKDPRTAHLWRTLYKRKATPRGASPSSLPSATLEPRASVSSFLYGRGRRPSEIVVVGHPVVDVVVERVTAGALGERLHRIGDFLEVRVLGPLRLEHLVPDIELLAQDRIGRLVEA